MYKDKRVIHIVCTGKNGEIGCDNKLLFNLPPDMKFFREQTLGHVILMGRKTTESLHSPLDRRVVVEVSNRCSFGSLPRDNLTWSLRKSEKYSDL